MKKKMFIIWILIQSFTLLQAQNNLTLKWENNTCFSSTSINIADSCDLSIKASNHNNNSKANFHTYWIQIIPKISGQLTFVIESKEKIGFSVHKMAINQNCKETLNKGYKPVRQFPSNLTDYSGTSIKSLIKMSENSAMNILQSIQVTPNSIVYLELKSKIKVIDSVKIKFKIVKNERFKIYVADKYNKKLIKPIAEYHKNNSEILISEFEGWNFVKGELSSKILKEMKYVGLRKAGYLSRTITRTDLLNGFEDTLITLCKLYKDSFYVFTNIKFINDNIDINSPVISVLSKMFKTEVTLKVELLGCLINGQQQNDAITQIEKLKVALVKNGVSESQILIQVRNLNPFEIANLRENDGIIFKVIQI